VQLLKYQDPAGTNSEFGHRVQQLTLLARALASEIQTLQAELSRARGPEKKLDFDSEGIDFYDEVERYEIELIRAALTQCGGNQSQAAKLLHMKSTTLNAKMKHYGVNAVRSITLQRLQSK
jgi:DNA-binding NtrC family response regulator